MEFCPVPHTSRDQVWLGVGAGLGAAFVYCCARRRAPSSGDGTAPPAAVSSGVGTSSTAQIVGNPFDPSATPRSQPSVESSAETRIELATIRDAPLSSDALAAATKDFCVVSSTRLDVNAVVNEVVAPGAGGVALFIGTTRDNFNGRPVEQLEYEAYDSMAVKEMRKVFTACYYRRCTLWLLSLTKLLRMKLKLYHVLRISCAQVCAAMRARHTSNGGLHKVAIVHRVRFCKNLKINNAFATEM